MYTNNLPTLTTVLLKDLVELSILTYFCYRWLQWLQRDTQKPLLNYFYGYCALLMLSSYIQLATLSWVLSYSFPLVIMLFVLVHQQSLQKNFIGLYKVKPAHKVEHDWLAEIVRFCLQAPTDLYFLCEHTTSFAELIHTDISLQAPVHCRLLQFISHASGFNPDQYILIDTEGNLLGINVTWKRPLVFEALEKQPIEKTCYYLIDSDGYLLHYAHKTRNFTIVIGQKIYPGLNGAQVLQSITHYLHTHKNKQRNCYEAHRTSSSCQPPA